MVNEARFSALLSEFAATLASESPLSAVLDHLVVRIVHLLNVSAAGCTVITTDAAPRYIAASDLSARRFEQLQTDLDQGPCVVAHGTGVPVLLPDLREDTRFPTFGPAALAAGLVAVFAFPLGHGGSRFGALDLYRDSAGPLTPREVEVAATLADVVAAYVINARAREETTRLSEGYRREALHDALTGLPNRPLLKDRLQHAAARGARSGTASAVLFVDLDKFKSVNDTHGHAVGDQLLRAVADRLSRGLRSGDTLARVGGDEFVLLCEDLGASEDAAVVAERLHRCLAEPFVLGGGLTISVRASVGVAYSGPGREVSEALVAEADAAMYVAKRQRNSHRYAQDGPS